MSRDPEPPRPEAIPDGPPEPEPAWDDEEYDAEDEFDCHQTADGGCELAGTEECDWECPYHD